MPDLHKEHDAKSQAEIAAHVALKRERNDRHHRAHLSAHHEADVCKRQVIESFNRQDRIIDRNDKARLKDHPASDPRAALPLQKLYALRRVFRQRYGLDDPECWQFPSALDDDAAADDFSILMHHVGVAALALNRDPEAAIKAECLKRAPWAKPSDIEVVKLKLSCIPHVMAADELGKRLNLSDADRTELKAWTIKAVDITDAELADRRRKQDRERKAEKRRAEGARLRSESLAQVKPWDQLGISRATYFRRKMHLRLNRPL